MNNLMIVVIICICLATLTGCAGGPKKYYSDVFTDCMDNPIDKLANNIFGTKRNGQDFCAYYSNRRVKSFYGRTK